MIVMSKIIEYFHDYCDSEGPTTYPGFLKYLARTNKFDPSMLSELKSAFVDDIEVLQYIKTVCEGYVVDDSIQGLLNSSMAQFVLKHKHGYVENTETQEQPKVEIEISIE